MGIVRKILGPKSKYDKSIPYTYFAKAPIVEGDESLVNYYFSDTICGLIEYLDESNINPEEVELFGCYLKKEIPIDKEQKNELGQNPNYVDLEKIADAADGLSGADVAAIANTAVSLVIHEFLGKYKDQKEAEKEVDNTKVTMRHFEEAVKKVRIQKELKVGEKLAVPYYR